MIGTIAAVVGFVIAAVLVFATTKPDVLRVRRSISIKAPPERIFPLINDLHNWAAWSPWEKLDPAMKKTHSGAAQGKGAVYAWEGNAKVGAGRMEITNLSQPSKVTIKLDFIKPLEGHNTAEFTLDAQGDATQVTWSMVGPARFITKVMQVFFSMDRMIGKNFEDGLASLKRIAET